MVRQMNESESRYVQINNKNNQINLSSIISRFSKVRRFLTPAEMRVCLKKGASLYSVNGDELTPLTESNYNMIEDESVPEEVKEPVIPTETPVVEKIKEPEVVVSPSSTVAEETKSEEDEIVPDTDDETVPENVEEEVVEIK